MVFSLKLVMFFVTVLIQQNNCALQPLTENWDKLHSVSENMKRVEMSLRSAPSTKSKRDIDLYQYKSSEESTGDEALELLVGKHYYRQLKLQQECIERERSDLHELAKCLEITVGTTVATTPIWPSMSTSTTQRPSSTTSASHTEDTFTWAKIVQCQSTGFASTSCSQNLLNFLKAFDYNLYNECKTSQLKSIVCRIKAISLILDYENSKI